MIEYKAFLMLKRADEPGSHDRKVRVVHNDCIRIVRRSALKFASFKFFSWLLEKSLFSDQLKPLHGLFDTC